MALDNYIYFSTLLLLVFTLILRKSQKPSVLKGFKSPPGPPGLPIIGNAHQMGSAPQRTIQRWAKQYGELVKVRLGYENWVFINSPEGVREIFDKQSAITSGRSPQPVASGLVSGNNRLLFLTYGPEWRKLRAIVHKLLTPKASSMYKEGQEFEAKQLIYDIATSNEDQESFYMHIRRYTTSVVLTSTYGLRVPTWDCEEVKSIYQVMADFSEASEPGAYIADLFPPLAKIPSFLQWWRPGALQRYERQKKIWFKFWHGLLAKIKDGKAPECFVKHFVETGFEKQGISEVQAAFVAGSMIEAGSETTSSALNSAVLYLMANPHIQDRANEEISRIVGDVRSPTYNDEENLPYIRAMGKEVLRIRPVTTIGSPHYTTSDVVYKDYLIPKNTVVCMSQYTLHFDSKRWNNPEEFDPGRYLDYPHKVGVYAAMADPEARDHFDFGAGRRICPGMHLAENSMFITLAKILWAFKIEPAIGPNGEFIPVYTSDSAYEPGINTLPRPFKARFVPRSEKRLRTLKDEWAQAQKDGYFLGDRKVGVDGVEVRS